MASFSLPPFHDAPDKGWGPSFSNIPEQFKFKDIPYAPFSKSDKLGRFADWNDPAGDGRQATVGAPTTRDPRGTAGRSRRDGAQAFGSGTASAFAYFHVEDESSFSLVDNKAAPPRRGNAFARGRALGRGATPFVSRGAQRTRGGTIPPNKGAQRGGRRGWRDWEKVALLNPTCTNFLISIPRTIARESPLLRSRRSGACWKRSNSIVFPNSSWTLTIQKICM